MKKSRAVNILLRFFFFAFCALSIADLYFRVFPSQNIFLSHSIKSRDELFDPQFDRYNSISKLEERADSEYQLAAPFGNYTDNRYPEIVSVLVRTKFHHGYPFYSIGNNFIAFLIGAGSGRGYHSIIKGDDLAKYSFADCRQQSLVMMELLMRKGYNVRAVYFRAPEYKQEHVAFEVNYLGDWHLYDPDMEPNAHLLFDNHRPSVAKLSKDTSLLKQAYWRYDPKIIQALISNAEYKATNYLIPSYLYWFHTITMFLSNWALVICVGLYFVFIRKRRGSVSKSTIKLPNVPHAGMQRYA